MARVFYLHYNREEAVTTVKQLRAADHVVSFHWSTEVPPKINRQRLPEVVVISLARLPSHARRLAQWLCEAKYRQSIPVIFVGGAPEKVAIAKEQFPRANFCPGSGLLRVVERAVGASAARSKARTR